ncbi:MAG: hypothetical protein COB67_06245 [SAR324 cluster bacterium]|uniref:Heme exporter protein D n=1 Tax=SAR324 cluster bacterium TaxID=2024889 RepID=A0A2A4T5A9_9DELT|nr:MAG: hypothetical protein COB67_06245 [SAR324 cluster bacterium]
MPRNAEYLIATYAITGTVIFVYTLRMLIKLKQVKNKLRNLQEED